MVHGKKRIPYWIDRRLNGLAGPDYDATISFRSPIEPEDSQYGQYWLKCDGHTLAKALDEYNYVKFTLNDDSVWKAEYESCNSP